MFIFHIRSFVVSLLPLWYPHQSLVVFYWTSSSLRSSDFVYDSGFVFLWKSPAFIFLFSFSCSSDGFFPFFPPFIFLALYFFFSFSSTSIFLSVSQFSSFTCLLSFLSFLPPSFWIPSFIFCGCSLFFSSNFSFFSFHLYILLLSFLFRSSRILSSTSRRRLLSSSSIFFLHSFSLFFSYTTLVCSLIFLFCSYLLKSFL